MYVNLTEFFFRIILPALLGVAIGFALSYTNIFKE